MNEQRRQIKAEIDRVYNVQVDVMNRVKKEEQSKFETETYHLQNINKHRKDLEETSRHLLEQTPSLDFISRSYTFLSYNRLKELPEDTQKIWKRWLYRHPSYKQTLDPKPFQEYVQQHILGYFAPDRPEQGSIQSLYSVGASSHATAWSGTHRLSYISTVSAFPALNEEASTKPTRKTVELVAYINRERFEVSHLKTFHIAFFSGQSMWICG